MFQFLGYNLLPVVVFVSSFILVFRLILIPMKYERGKMAVSFALSGFFGYFVFLPFPFYDVYHDNYILVSISFFFIAMIGVIGTIINNVNPLHPGEKLYILNKRENAVVESYKSEFQTETDSINIIKQELFKLGSPIYTLKNITMKHQDDKWNFHFLTLTPYGLYIIQPCNWSGEIDFTETGGTQREKNENDTKDYVVSSIYSRTSFLTRILRSIELENTPIHTVICLTNKKAKPIGDTKKYKVVTIEELTKQFNGEMVLVNSQIDEMRKMFEQYAKD